MAEWAAAEREVIEGFFRFSPSHAREAGDHRFDGVVGDPSRSAIRARVEEIDRQIARLDTLAQLTQEQDIDRRALVGQLNAARFELTELRTPFREPMFYAGYGTELAFKHWLAKVQDRPSKQSASTNRYSPPRSQVPVSAPRFRR